MCPMQNLKLQTHACKSGALPTELTRLTVQTNTFEKGGWGWGSRILAILKNRVANAS